MAPTPRTKFHTPTGFRAIYYHKSLPIDNPVDKAYPFLDVKADGTVQILDSDATGGSDPQNAWKFESSPVEDHGNLGQFEKLLKDQTSLGKDQNKQSNLTISIGGWNNSAHFSHAFSTEEGRSTFVSSLSSFLTTFPHFNGISIDWEYLSSDGVNYGKEGNSVSTADGDNFILVLQKLRAELPGYSLALCCNAAPEKNHWPIQQVVELLDELHVMTDDFHDGNFPGDTQKAHHTNLRKSSAGKWSAEEATEFFLGKGVPASKLFIGGALSSQGFSNTTGIGKPASGGSSHQSWEGGVMDYKAQPVSGSTEMWDDKGNASYKYDATAQGVDTTSILEKAKFIKKKKLGGIILWETSGDAPHENTDHHSIFMKALHDNLTHG